MSTPTYAVQHETLYWSDPATTTRDVAVDHTGARSLAAMVLRDVCARLPLAWGGLKLVTLTGMLDGYFDAQLHFGPGAQPVMLTQLCLDAAKRLVEVGAQRHLIY